MKKSRRQIHWAPVVLSSMLMGCMAALPASAGVIPFDVTDPTVAISHIGGPGLGNVVVPVIITSTPNAESDNNVDVNFKRFDNAGYIDIEFNVNDSGGTTTYRVAEAVDNNVGSPGPIVPWIGYRVELGFDVGTNFTLATPADGLSFATAATTFSDAFASHAFDADAVVLTYSNGMHASGQEAYEFRINVPDGIGRFTLRQTPVPIPEPGGLALIGLAMSFAGGFARRIV